MRATCRILPVLFAFSFALTSAALFAQTRPSKRSPSCGSLDACAYQLVNSRITANQENFFVYLDQDSGFNHGFPSGFFGETGQIAVDTGCLNDPADQTTGCFPPDDKTHLDKVNGTVFRITFASLSSDAGVNVEEPQNWGVLDAKGECGVTVSCNGYDLRGATKIEFDVRSPDGITLQFGVGECQTQFITLPASQTFTHMAVALSSLGSCQNGALDLSKVNVLFTVVTDYIHAPNGGTVLLDNIQFTTAVPRRTNQGLETSSFPLSTTTYGVVPQLEKPIPLDQVNRNLTSIYESSLSMLALLQRGQSDDVVNAQEIANTFDYALFHDNHGDFLPLSPGSQGGCYDGTPAAQCGLHSAYKSGDVALFNDQYTPAMGKAGDVRLAGFTAGIDLCGASLFCLVQDGATGGNNAFAILALATAYQQLPSHDPTYLNDALAIGNWIVGNLTDNSPMSYGGYFVGYFGYSDCTPSNCPKGTLNVGKSTENNADIFSAFSLLAQIEAALGNGNAAAQWTNNANVAGNFVMAMFDPINGHFNVGTVPAGTLPGPGICPDGPQKGNDVINTCDFLDANSFPMLELAGSTAFGVSSPDPINWQLPLQYILNFSSQSGTFTQTVTADGLNFSGFDLVPAPPNTGVAWEFTGQAVATCSYIDVLYNQSGFQPCVGTYQQQIVQAFTSAPFADGLGVVASTLENGDTLLPGDQCLQTPFQCIPERVGLAATTWAIFAEQGLNPLFFPALTVNRSGTGNGTVTSADGYINCGVVCSYSYFSGTQVSLTATPSQGSSFGSWSGCDSSSGNSCSVTMISSRTVSATFTLIPVYYTLTVYTSGTGTVTSTDGFIDCPGTCSHTYLSNTQVTLNATPGQGWVFGGWSGACLGTGSCTVTMTQSLSVDGIFSQALQFVAVTPCRLVDTRQTGGAIQSGSSRDFPVQQEGGCNIPATAAAYSLNVTVVPQGQLGYLTIWPTGEGRPVVSTLNSLDGRVKANAAIVPAGTSGDVSVFVTDTTNVVLDIDGYFAPVSGSTLAFYPLPPCRVADTRDSTKPTGLGPPQLSSQTPRSFPVLSSTCIPTGVNPAAYSFNFTVVPGGHSMGYLSVWPTGQAQPVVSTLNDQTGTIVANAAIVPAGSDGDISVYSTDDTQLVIDIDGYFAAAAQGGLSLYAVAPCRVIDTRHVGNGQPFTGTLTPPVDVVDSPCGPPATAQAYVFNATVVPPGSLGYLTLWPDGQQQPVVSTLNATDGSITNNMAIVPAGNQGQIDAYANGLTQLILDISSYFAP
jgi:hypothetical protein